MIPKRILDGSTQYNLETAACTFTFTPVIAEKAVTVKASDTTNGTITLSSTKTDAGETFSFTLTPVDGYKVKKGSVTATLTAGGNTTSLTVKGTALEYSIVLPGEIGENALVEIAAAFTPGVQEGGGSGANGSNTTSVGVSVAVGVLINNNKAFVENAQIAAKDLKVNAENKTTHNVEADAGYSSGDIGIGGAVAVNVAVVKSISRIDDTAKVTLADGDLEVTAQNENEFETIGNAKGSEKAKSTGVGAGIAVAVTGTETKALIENGAKIVPAAEKKLDNVNVNASTTEKATVKAVAGSAGGISITPVLALEVGGTETLAEIGTYDGTELVCAGDVNVNAESDLTRELDANAAASGGSVGVGGAFTISVLNDTTNAKLSRSTKAKNVNVKTKARNRAKSTSKASANGAASSGGDKSDSGDGDGDSSGSGDSDKPGVDKQADGMLGGAGKLAGHVNAGGTSGSGLSTKAGSRQSASTTEGGIEVAGALALNIQTTKVKAEIADGITVTAGDDEEDEEDADSSDDDEKGAVTVQSLALNESEIAANGSAANGKVGVGVAVAINIVDYENIAVIGDSAVTADKLTVEAKLIPEDEKDDDGKEEEKEDPDDDADWLGDLIKDAVTGLVNNIIEATGLSDVFGDSAAEKVGEIIKDAVKDARDALLEGTGLEELLSNNPLEQVKKNLANLKAKILSLPNDLKEELKNLVKEIIGEAQFGLIEEGSWKELWNKVWTDTRTAVIEYAKTELWQEVQKQILDNVVKIAQPIVMSYVTPAIPGQPVPENEKLTAQIKDAFMNKETGILKNIWTKVTEDVKKILTEKLEAAKGFRRRFHGHHICRY